MKKRAAKLQKVVHFCTAFVLLLKGISKLAHPHGYEAIIALFFASAIYIAAITILHDRLHQYERLLTASVYVIEAVVTGIMAWLYLAEGKRALGTVASLAPVLFTIALIVHLVKTSRGNAHEHAHS
jgi:hypothetical protein